MNPTVYDKMHVHVNPVDVLAPEVIVRIPKVCLHRALLWEQFIPFENSEFNPSLCVIHQLYCLLFHNGWFELTMIFWEDPQLLYDLHDPCLAKDYKLSTCWEVTQSFLSTKIW